MIRPSWTPGFRLGTMISEAAERHGAVPVTLDRPLDIAPGLGLNLDYVTLASLVEDLAAGFWAAGVRPTERVAVHTAASPGIALIACALTRIGAVPALLAPGLDGTVVRELLGRLGRPWLVTDPATRAGTLAGAGLDAVARAVLDATTLVDGGAGGPGGSGGSGGSGDGPVHRRDPVWLHPWEPSLITHSSGTTGLPKLAVHCPATMWNRLVPQLALGLPYRGLTAALCMSYVHSRFYHALGVWLRYGSPLVLMTDHRPEYAGPLLARHRPGIVETHPNTFVLWEDLADAPGQPLGAVRCYGSTFDAIHPRTISRLLGASRAPSPRLIQLYGQSETGPVIAGVFTRGNLARRGARAVGRPLPGFTRVRIVDDAGRPVPRGVTGHIEVRTRGRILTYLGPDSLTSGSDHDGWWRMGDVGSIGRWGRLHLADREIDRIDSVSSNLDVEDVLMERLPEVREVVVVPGPDGAPVTLLCTQDDVPVPAVRWRDATRDLPALGDPLLCPFDGLPRTGTWKVKRVELAQRLADGALSLGPAVA